MNLADPALKNIPVNTPEEIGAWRETLKAYLLKKRKFLCDYCSRPITSFTGGDLHEGIVTRGMAQGTKWKGIIFTEVNVFLLHPICHIKVQNDRDWAWSKSVSYYGEDIVRDWYNGLPWKRGHPPRSF